MGFYEIEQICKCDEIPAIMPDELTVTTEERELKKRFLTT